MGNINKYRMNKHHKLLKFLNVYFNVLDEIFIRFPFIWDFGSFGICIGTFGLYSLFLIHLSFYEIIGILKV